MSKQMGKEERKTEETWAELSPAFSFFFSFCFLSQRSEHKLGMPKVNHLLMLRKLLQKDPVSVPPATGSIKSHWLICFLPVWTLDLSCISWSSSMMQIDFCLTETPLCFDSLHCLAVVLLYMGRYAHINLWATRKTIYSCLSQVCCLTLALGDYGFLDHGPRHFVPSPDSLWMLVPQIQLYNNFYFDDPFLCILLKFVCNHSDQKM